MKLKCLLLLALIALWACSVVNQFNKPITALQTGQIQIVKNGLFDKNEISTSFNMVYYKSILVTEDKLLLSSLWAIGVFDLDHLNYARDLIPSCQTLVIRQPAQPDTVALNSASRQRTSFENEIWFTQNKTNIYASTNYHKSNNIYYFRFLFSFIPEGDFSEHDPNNLFVRGCSPHIPLLKPDQKAPTDYAGIAVTPQDQVYLAAMNEHRIYQIKDGTLIPFAGTGTTGNQDGPAEQAQFQKPRAIESDAEGNLYVLEADAPRLRKITPQGHVSTLAGSLESGYADGQGAEARFNQPYDLAINTKGEILIADTGNHRIRKVTPDGQVTTVLGTGEKGYSEGNQATAKVGNPMGLDFAPDDTLYYIAEGRVFRTKF